MAVVGPTATGKTELAVFLAERLGGEVVSGDAFQIYREMSIGTAKPTAAEMRGVPHHLIDSLPASEGYSLGRYLADAGAAVADIHSRGKLPIICGGTGLYISSLLSGTMLSESASSPAFRAQMHKLAQEEGNEALHARLAAVDPRLAKTLHPNNVGRIIRALEVFEVTGKTMSEHHALSKPDEPVYAACIIGLSARDRAFLYERADRRIDGMMAAGLLAEAERLYAGDCSPQAAQAIGYKELKPYLEGRCDLESCVAALKQATRHYLKRQLTWFRRDARVHWLFIDTMPPDELRREALRIAADPGRYCAAPNNPREGMPHE